MDQAVYIVASELLIGTSGIIENNPGIIITHS
jgi:hypothetical protein